MKTRKTNRTGVHISGIICLVLLAMTLGCAERESITFENDEGPCPAANEFLPVDIIAEMTYYEVPSYPRLAKLAGLEGEVWIKGQIGNRGSVLQVLIYKSSGTPTLDEAARVAALKCKFNPAMMNGEPVCMWVTWKVEFSLE